MDFTEISPYKGKLSYRRHVQQKVWPMRTSPFKLQILNFTLTNIIDPFMSFQTFIDLLFRFVVFVVLE